MLISVYLVYNPKMPHTPLCHTIVLQKWSYFKSKGRIIDDATCQKLESRFRREWVQSILGLGIMSHGIIRTLSVGCQSGLLSIRFSRLSSLSHSCHTV